MSLVQGVIGEAQMVYPEEQDREELAGPLTTQPQREQKSRVSKASLFPTSPQTLTLG